MNDMEANMKAKPLQHPLRMTYGATLVQELAWCIRSGRKTLELEHHILKVEGVFSLKQHSLNPSGVFCDFEAFSGPVFPVQERVGLVVEYLAVVTVMDCQQNRTNSVSKSRLHRIYSASIVYLPFKQFFLNNGPQIEHALAKKNVTLKVVEPAIWLQRLNQKYDKLEQDEMILKLKQESDELKATVHTLQGQLHDTDSNVASLRGEMVAINQQRRQEHENLVVKYESLRGTVDKVLALIKHPHQS